MATTVQQSSHIKFPNMRERSQSSQNHVPRPYFGHSENKDSTRSHNGTGKRVATILADQGDHVMVVADQTYQTRHPGHDVTSRRPIKGWRPMHQSTLKIPTQDHTDYLSSSKRVRKL